jgi:hypothetical protein
VRDQLNQFVLAHTIRKRALKMKGQLLSTIQCNQGRDSDQAPVALGQAGPFPNVAKQDLLREFEKLRRDVAEQLPRRRFRLLRVHWFFSGKTKKIARCWAMQTRATGGRGSFFMYPTKRANFLRVAVCNGVVNRFGEPEIEQLHLTLGRDLDVGGFQIPVNHAALWNRPRRNFSPSAWGKASTVVQIAFVLAVVAGLVNGFVVVLKALTVALTVWSGIDYARRAVHTENSAT